VLLEVAAAGGLAAIGAVGVWRLGLAGGPYTAGPWPGLTPRGAAVLLSSAAILAGLISISGGRPERAWPDLALLSLLSSLPVLLATRIVSAPGAAAAVCGAYLLPRTLLTLVQPAVFEVPPLLLVPAFVLDLAAWLRSSDLRMVWEAWPGRRDVWRRRSRSPRGQSAWRGAVAGGLYAVTLGAFEPAFALVLGADSASWQPRDVLLATAIGAASCALAGAALLARQVQQRHSQKRPHHHC
jgi:hypothetical protein